MSFDHHWAVAIGSAAIFAIEAGRTRCRRVWQNPGLLTTIANLYRLHTYRAMATPNSHSLQALFIHGMGRSPLSGWPLLRQLQRAGLKTATFGYLVSLDDFSSITSRLVSRIEQLAARGDYVLIGHSLGGVLLRAAVSALPPGIRLPRHVFLLGSPMRPARLAQRLQDKLLYRLATRDCGQLLGSAERMQAIPPLAAPTTVVIGIRGFPGSHGPFGREENDGAVAASEVAANGVADEVRVPVVHTLLPSSRLVTAVILRRLAQDRAADGAPGRAD